MTHGIHGFEFLYGYNFLKTTITFYRYLTPAHIPAEYQTNVYFTVSIESKTDREEDGRIFSRR